ncbi:hypothetical protein E2C01_053121 [Portunus trituberculatus]|uniref:Uncharacterized protein n=1 Tax=Portunus trituberculatus TaxID=210409 RepID=A0A5B7GPH1_PORTR|nr:hypothetical protein [Portunus trituberculatus]
MKPNEKAHKGNLLRNVKQRTNPTQECVVNEEDPTWQIPETELTDPIPVRYSSQPAGKWGLKLNDGP